MTINSKPSKYPEWATDGAADVVEPSLGAKQTGWTRTGKAPAPWMNWFQKLVHDWIKHMDLFEVVRAFSTWRAPDVSGVSNLGTGAMYRWDTLRGALVALGDSAGSSDQFAFIGKGDDLIAQAEDAPSGFQGGLNPCLAFSPDLDRWAAPGDGNPIVGVIGHAQRSTSSNIWTAQTGTMGGNPSFIWWDSVNAMFVAFRQAASDVETAYSTDGTTFTAGVTISGLIANITAAAVTASGELIVGGRDSSGDFQIRTIDDITSGSWATPSTPPAVGAADSGVPNLSVGEDASGSEIVVASIGAMNETVYVSDDDGDTWTAATMTGMAAVSASMSFMATLFHRGIWFVVASNSAVLGTHQEIYYSTDAFENVTLLTQLSSLIGGSKLAAPVVFERDPTTGRLLLGYSGDYFVGPPNAFFAD